MFERNGPSLIPGSLKWLSMPLFFWIATYSMQSSASETLNYLVIEEQAAPFQIIDEAGNNSGIISDLLFTIFHKSTHNINVSSFPFKRMIKEINAGLHGNWITYGSSKWSPPQNLNLSECSILTVKHSLLSLKRKNISFNGVESLLDKRLILLFGFEYPKLDLLLEEKLVHELRVLNYDSAFKALNRERGIGFVEMESRIKYNLKQTGNSIDDYDFFDLASVIPQYDIRFSFSPEMPKSVIEYIDARCEQLKQSGEFELIVNRYIN